MTLTQPLRIGCRSLLGGLVMGLVCWSVEAAPSNRIAVECALAMDTALILKEGSQVQATVRNII